MRTLYIKLPLLGSLTLLRYPAQFAFPLHSEKFTHENGTSEYLVAWGRPRLYLTPWSAVKAERMPQPD